MIADQFRARFGADPHVVVRAPGRVNLIGEHLDYAGLPVLPMAIDRSVLVAVGPGEGRWESLARPGEAGWKPYVSAALAECDPVGDVDLLLGGDLPTMGGLSSSSALVVAVLLAADRIGGRPEDPAALIERAIRAEHSLGVEGGPMDQTVIVLADANSALRIDFLPYSSRRVPLPDDLAVVVAHSGEEAAKATAARHAYNLRVVTARAVAALIAHQHGRDPGDPPSAGRVRDVPGPSWFPQSATARAVAAVAHIDVERLVGLTAGHFDPDTELPIRAGADHLLSEPGRVDAMEQALIAADPAGAGRLLDASHASLQRLGTSTPGLDRVVAAMRDAGALGARLTGAGFGGFAVAFCRAPFVDAVVDAAISATGGPAFEVRAGAGAEVIG